MHKLAIAGWMLLVTSCVVEDVDRVGVVEQETQCGPNEDLQHVELYDGTLGVSKAFVARHETRVGYATQGCSGTLISEDLFLSAGHCEYAVGDSVWFDHQLQPDGTMRASRAYGVIQVVESEFNAQFDYAIVRLEGGPGREYGHAILSTTEPPLGSQVTVIGHPAERPKQVSTGAYLDIPSTSPADHWFRHQADTIEGSSGSGVLDAAGRLIGVHTSGGCATTAPVEGNRAMRMSQLVPHSPTLQALVRSKLLWQHTTGAVSLWTQYEQGPQMSYVEHGPFTGWTPISLSNNRLLWRHTSGKISFWVLRDDGTQQSYVEHGPYDGWTAINQADNHILWRHTTGRISLWTIDDAGQHVGYLEHGPYPGWTAISYANNHILWRHDNGAISLWRVDDFGHYVSHAEHGPFPGWTAQSYDNGEIVWKSAAGGYSLWTVDRTGKRLSAHEEGPFDGWQLAALEDRRATWVRNDGLVLSWEIDSEGAYLQGVPLGTFAGWSPILTTGGRP